jgi:hypothetical protein
MILFLRCDNCIVIINAINIGSVVVDTTVVYPSETDDTDNAAEVRTPTELTAAVSTSAADIFEEDFQASYGDPVLSQTFNSTAVHPRTT